MTRPPHGPWPPPGGHGAEQRPGPQHGPPPHWPPPTQQLPPLSPPPPSPPGPPPPPKKPRTPVLAVVLGTVGLLVVGLVVVVSLNAGRQSNTSGAGQQTSASATASPPAAAPPPAAPSSSSKSGGAGRPQAGGKVLKLADHPILQDPNAGLKNLACPLPRWRSEQAAAEAFFTAAQHCLNAAWGPFLEAYNLPFTPPALHFPRGPSFQTECGTIQVGIATAAYYCENNLYVPFNGLQTDQYGDNPGVYLALFAHEYGHHVQEVAGLMDAAWERIYAAGPNSPAGLEMSRRKELQAQCFSGMFLGAHVDRGGSITRDMYNKAWQDQETRGDDTSGSHDHGSNAHYADWWRTGAKDNRIAKCNTFAAPPGDVS